MEKKKEKKRQNINQEMIMMLPFMIYAGSGRYMLTFDGKRKYIKIAQIQELVLHTIPLGCLVWYNNKQEIEYSDDLYLAMQITFTMLFFSTLAELVCFYFMKVAHIDIEINDQYKKPYVSSGTMKAIGIGSVLVAIGAVVLGTQAFNEQNCKDLWFVHDDNICKDCIVYFGNECTACTNSTQCDTCEAGYFWATADDATLGIVAANETRCRSC